VRYEQLVFCLGPCDVLVNEKKINSALGARNLRQRYYHEPRQSSQARVAIGGAGRLLYSGALDRRDFNWEVDCDLTHHTGPSLGPAAVSSALLQWLVFAHSIYRRTGAISVGISQRLFMSAPSGMHKICAASGPGRLGASGRTPFAVQRISLSALTVQATILR